MLKFPLPLVAGNRTDAVIMALFAVLGSIPAILAFSQVKYTFFYQNFTPEAVMWACGYGMRHPLVVNDQLAAFLLGQLQSFDCSNIDPQTQFGPVGIFATVQPCLTWLTAILWRVLGINQMSLLPLVIVIASLYGSGCYALSRVFLSRFPAIIGAAILCISPVATEMSLSLRDNSKAPFFIWAVVFLILALPSRIRSKNLIFAILAGLTVGIGYGFRSDLAVMVPIGVVILSISALASARANPLRLLAPLAFLAALGLSALPVILQTNIFVTNVGTLTIQGTTEDFRNFAGIEPAGYALGWTYSDELTLSEVASAERPRIPDWDAREGQPLYGVSQAVIYSTSYLLGWAPLFAADFATQASKSVGWILGFPSLFIRSGMPATHYPGAFLLPVYQLLAKPFFPLFGMAGFIALLWRAYSRSRMEATCIFLLLAFLMGVVGIQLAIRHAFYLEFIWVISTLSLLSFALNPKLPAKRVRDFAVLLAIVAALICVAYSSLGRWQRAVLSEEIAALLGAPRERLEMHPSLRQDGGVFYALPVPAKHSAIVASQNDSLTPAIRLVGIQWNVRAEADRLIVTVGGNGCPTGIFKLRLAYEKSEDTWQPMDADLALEIRSDGTSASAFFPAFYRPTQHFGGVVIPASHNMCSVVMERIASASALPVVMSGIVSDMNLAGPLTKGFGGFSATLRTPGIIEVTPK